ncbi:dipeptide ABC transporter ATP-binding protein [Candidatus Gillettellia adelgis]
MSKPVLTIHGNTGTQKPTVNARLQLPPQRVLTVRNLSVNFYQKDNTVQAVRNLCFEVNRGETLAIVGESGSGKSVTSLALMRLVEHDGGHIISGISAFRRRNGEVVDLIHMPQNTLQKVRGADIAMVFQEPMTSLNPVFPIGVQITESLQLHQRIDNRSAQIEALRMLDLVCIPEAPAMLRRYPYQLSGGMRQRVMIAIALACKPSLLIADEPTTALDVTIQAQILQLIQMLQQEMQMAVIFISHDMGVVARISDRVLVMYHGEQVEQNTVHQLFSAPQHSYTQALLMAVPKLGAMADTRFPVKFPIANKNEKSIPQDTVLTDSPPIIQVKHLITRFNLRSGILNRITHRVHAVENISFDIYPGETLGLVGESGCGKSTAGRALLKLVDSQHGTITFNGCQINRLHGVALQRLRQDIQIIFQDPYAALDPRLTVGFSIMEPLLVHHIMTTKEARRRVATLLERVGLLPEHALRYPHEFSGGQRQRICIARAIALNPKLLVADEAVSALDVSIQAQIINLLFDLQRELGIAFLFISHDIAVIERISHRVAVMYMGQIVEIGPRQAVFNHPQHAYTRQLMAAVLIADPNHTYQYQRLWVNDMPSSIRALGDEPITAPLVEIDPGHFVARHPISNIF